MRQDIPYKTMPDLLPGDAVLYRFEYSPALPATWLAAIVRTITGCKLNHTALTSENGGMLMLNEAIGRGIVSRALGLHLTKSFTTKIVIRRPRKPFDGQAFIERANSKIGLKYDVTSLVWHSLIYQAMKRLGLKPYWNGKTGEKAEGKMQCAEYYAWCMGWEKPWEYSTREIFEHPELETIYSEL